MRRGGASLLAVAAMTVPVVGLGSGATAVEPPPELTNLDPGGAAHVTQEVPVTVVYIGLEPGAPPLGIDAAATEAAQPQQAALPHARLAHSPRPMGLEYSYRYDVVFADTAFEDAFFGYLSSIAFGPLPPTFFQSFYSGLAGAAETIDANWIIDANAAEAWLNGAAEALLGIDTTRPTVFFVNWHGRPDFRFHTYADFHQTPGLPFPVGVLGFAQMSAWGGSTPDDPQLPGRPLARSWFYDVSAGPDFTTSNWALETPEIGIQNGVPDRRIPPVWEYGTDHWFMPFTDLSADLADVLRFVAIDLLFTASPLYDPALSPPLLSDEVNIDVNVFEEKGGAPVPDFGLAPAPFAALDPSRAFTVDVSSMPLARIEEPYECFKSAFGGNVEPCFASEGVPHPGYDLAFELDRTRQRYLDFTRYEAPVAFYAVPDHRAVLYAVAGISLEQYEFGVQHWNHVWGAPSNPDFFRDPLLATVHETGHHIGIGHPHDGFDGELGVDFGPEDQFAISWLGDMSASNMSYLGNTLEFSQFDRDNMDRWMVAVRLQWANRILADIYDSGAAASFAAELLEADALAGSAQDLVGAWDLRGASIAARDAYAKVVEVAGLAGVPVESWGARADQGPTGWAAWVENPVVGGSGSSLAARATRSRDWRVPEPRPLLPPGAESLADLDHTPLVDPPP